MKVSRKIKPWKVGEDVQMVAVDMQATCQLAQTILDQLEASPRTKEINACVIEVEVNINVLIPVKKGGAS